jgi:hypothetical protein
MNKMEKLGQLKNLAPEAITAEMVAAVNAELVEAGISGVEVNLTGALKNATEALTAAQTKSTELESKVSGLEAEVTKWKPKDAAEHTQPKGEKDKEVETENKEFEFDESPSAKALKEAGLN